MNTATYLAGTVIARIVPLLFVLFMLCAANTARAEGSWQMGLFEGVSHQQSLYETDAEDNRSILRVDILNPGEVINVLACGTDNNSTLRVLMYNPSGTLIYNSTAGANVDCEDDFSANFSPEAVDAHQHITDATGVYEVHLTNLDGTYLSRFDVTVTNNRNEVINPRSEGGRLWSDYWYFWADSFAQTHSTDADLYVVADGGFNGSYYVWKLDLNNFAGFGYGLKANRSGVQSPNAVDAVVAGMSVPRADNTIAREYPIYLGYPARNYPLPAHNLSVSELVYVATDPNNSAVASSEGVFNFSTNLTTAAVYEIIIDTGSPTGGASDGSYGQGDVYLRGTAYPGDNAVPWNGKDNNGNDLSLMTDGAAYQAKVSIRTGEFHFTADDVETSGGPGDRGLKMYRVDSAGIESPTTLYWDDYTVLNSSASNAFNQSGIFDGDHNWGEFNAGGIGNVALIDTYTYGASVSSEPLRLDFSGALAVSGAVFEDNGILATPHDGLQTGEEAGLSGRVVELRDNNATLIDTAITDSAGKYTISIPEVLVGQALRVITPAVSGWQSISEATVPLTVSNDNVADGVVGFIAAKENLNIDFGKVKSPQWLSDNVAENSAGKVVFHTHRYRAASQGTLTFRYVEPSRTVDNTGFTASLYLDDNCNGLVDGSEQAAPASISVVAGQLVCVVNRVTIPVAAANDNSYHTTIAASIVYSDPLNTGHAVTDTRQVRDITRVIGAGEGLLVLHKTVQNLTTDAVVTSNNSASPGDVMRYSIDFQNTGNGPVTEVLIADSTPAFTVLDDSVQCPAVMPEGVATCQVLMPSPMENGAGYDGPIQWQFSGRLSAGAASRVTFRIRIE